MKLMSKAQTAMVAPHHAIVENRINNHARFSMSESDTIIVNEKLNTLKLSYLGKAADTIAHFQLNLFNRNLIKQDVYGFIDFLIGLYDNVPQAVLDLLPNANDLCTNEIHTCIEILQNNLD